MRRDRITDGSDNTEDPGEVVSGSFQIPLQILLNRMLRTSEGLHTKSIGEAELLIKLLQGLLDLHAQRRFLLGG